MSIHTVDRGEALEAVASKSWKTRFPPTIEAAFEKHTRRYRSRALRSSIVPSILVYNAFLLLDILLLPDTLALSALMHLAIVTPFMLFVGYALKREPGKAVRESLTVAIPLLMTSQIMLVYALNPGSVAGEYQYLAVMIMVYMNTVQRPDSRFAAGASAAMIALYLGFLLTGDSSFAQQLVGVSLMAAAAYLTLTANRRMERDARYAFLRTLQDGLQRQSAEIAANSDALTGLSNRRHLDEKMAQYWPALAADRASVGVIMIDLDHFKTLNDTHGHHAGDMCLRRVADVITDETGPDDLPVRYGGEEFAVVMPGASLTTTARMAERIRNAIEGACVCDEAGVLVTASLGVVAGPAADYTLSELLILADEALYEAKRGGKNQVRKAIPRAARRGREAPPARLALNGRAS